MAVWVAVIHKDKDSDFGVSFPDMPGCISAGSTLDEAMEMGREALEGHLEVSRDFGDDIPEPRSIDQLIADGEDMGQTTFLIDLPDENPLKRVNVTLSSSLLERLDAQARQVGMSRSGYIGHLVQMQHHHNRKRRKGDAA